MSAGIVFIFGSPDDVIDVLLLAGFFGFPGCGDFGDRIDAHRQHRNNAPLVLKAERVADSHAALFHRSRRERREANHVAGRVDVRHRSPMIFVHFDVATRADTEASLIQRQAVHRGAATGRKQDGLRIQDFAALHDEAHAARNVFHFHGPLLEKKAHAEAGKAIAQALGDFSVQKRQQAVTPVHERHLNAEGHED